MPMADAWIQGPQKLALSSSDLKSEVEDTRLLKMAFLWLVVHRFPTEAAAKCTTTSTP